MPTLVLHGEIDPRVPTSQGYEFYHALQRRGVESKLVVYPRTVHAPREPKVIQHLMDEHLEWIGRWTAPR